MNTFTASNGYKVTPNGDGANVYRGIMSTPIYPDEMQALREFFQAEADERAGRWRYPDEPQYVVYYDQMRDRVTVFNENLMDEDGGCGISRGNTLDYPSVQHIAQAYFAAHPEPEEYVIVWSGGLALTKPQTLPEARAELKRAWDTGEIFRLVPLDVAGEEQ